MRSIRKSVYDPEQVLLRNWLTEKRQAQNLTQRDLAIKLDIVHSFVGKVEQGERRLDVIEFEAYCHALEVDPNDFFSVLQQELRR